MDEESISCPYCGELIDVLIDSSVEEQQYFEDCSVCCSPILFDLLITETEKKITVRRDDE